jgi:hypothetical protein
LSLGRLGFTSTTLSAATTRHPATHALLQPRRAPRVLVFTIPAAAIYLDYTARPGASARRAARHTARCAARRRLLCLAQARHRLLRLRRASGCLATSRGSSSTTPPRPSSSSTTPPPVRPRHVAWLVTQLVAPLVVDYFAFAARPGASARHAARHAAHRAARRRLHRASGCLGTSCGSSRGSSCRSSSTTPCTTTSSCGHTSSTSATPWGATTCLAATLALLRVRRAPPQRRLPVASLQPFISTKFPN